MDKLLALTKKVEESKAALLAAKTEKDRKSALAAFEAAVEAKSKYKKTTVEEEEDDTSSEKDDEDSDESAEESASEDDDDKSEADSTEGDGDSDSKKALEGKTGLYTYSRLFRLAKQVARRATGDAHMTVEQVFTALDGIGANAKRNRKLETRLAKLENERTSEKISSLLERAQAKGQVTPAEAADFRADASKLGPEWLEKRLAKKPKVVRTIDDGPRLGNEQPKSADDPLAGRSAAERDIITRSAQRLGKTEAEVAQELDAQLRKQNGASVTRY